MVLHNPNNWHWVNKDVSGWAKDYLTDELVGTSAEQGDVTATIDSVTSMDGDVDVSQRKGKVITLFDVKVVLDFSGKAGETEASGTITIPEVAHDTEEDEYVFEITLHSESADKEPVKDLVRSKLLPQLRPKLQKLGPALITEHGKDIQHAPGTNPSGGFSTPKYISSSHISKGANSSSTTTTASSSGHGPAINVTSLNESTEMRTTASELFRTFTDPERITAFTRSKPLVFEGANKGGKFELFGGNISGEYAELDEPTKVVQKWRLAQWPAGHFSTLALTFDQNDVDGVTILRVDWQGVPVGQEEVVKRNWNEYYIRSIKITFGFGTVL